jgi:tetratricopeptide (TPR) repeat protein
MTKKITVLLIIAASIAGSVAAQGGWSAHTNAGEYAFARGDVARARSEFQKALEIAQGFPAGDKRLETSLENLARLYEHQSDFDRAQPMYQLMLAAREARLGVDDPALLDPLFAVARVSQPMGDLPTVEGSLERYATIAGKSGEADPRKHWQVLQMLARMQAIQEKPDEALTWQRQARTVITKDPNATSQERSTVLQSLAEMELVSGNGPEAERVYVEMAEILKEEDEADAFPDTMALGSETALAAGELETAERLAMRSINAHPEEPAEIQARKVLAEIAWIKVNRGTDDMANLLAAAGDSEDLMRARDRLRALAVLQEGVNIETIYRLAQVEALRGNPDSAARWQRQLLESLPPDSDLAEDARRNLVTLLAAAGELDAALAENAELLAQAEARYGDSDQRLMPILGQRLEILEDAKMKKEAKQVRKRMKRILRS